ncbi:hypothetical protein BTR25_14360 [Bacillus sp. MRMR6]|nr:hypothetical protein BTR25_14360 [Bacillus sp. MRMR6]
MLKGISKGKVIYQYSKNFCLIGVKWSRKQQEEINTRTIKYEFKRKEEGILIRFRGFYVTRFMFIEAR